MSKKFWKATAVRAIRTFAQSMISFIGVNAIALGDVNWLMALSAGGMGAVLSVLFALKGLPEVDE